MRKAFLWQDAECAFLKALEITPQKSNAYFSLVFAQLALGKRNKALKNAKEMGLKGMEIFKDLGLE